eukprot:2879316-Pyramimonas_sp.AAC.1
MGDTSAGPRLTFFNPAGAAAKRDDRGILAAGARALTGAATAVFGAPAPLALESGQPPADAQKGDGRP